MQSSSLLIDDLDQSSFDHLDKPLLDNFLQALVDNRDKLLFHDLGNTDFDGLYELGGNRFLDGTAVKRENVLQSDESPMRMRLEEGRGSKEVWAWLWRSLREGVHHASQPHR